MRRFNVVISDEAQADFAAIADYLERDSPFYALQLTRELRAAAD
jgi:plasmid stabilization system protein ParE